MFSRKNAGNGTETALRYAPPHAQRLSSLQFDVPTKEMTTLQALADLLLKARSTYDAELWVPPEQGPESGFLVWTLYQKYSLFLQ